MLEERKVNNILKSFLMHQIALFTSLGYRDMCKFFAKDIFLDNIFDDVDYFIRVDTDSFFIEVSDYFVKSLNRLNVDYAYLKDTIHFEDKAVTLGFGKCLYEFCIKNIERNHINKFFEEVCQEATASPKLFYTNFEVVNLKWARSKAHQEFLNYIVEAEGIYKFRWGDSIIRYYLVKLLNAKTLKLRGCLYKHSSLYDSRNFFKKYLGKIYSKLTNKLHINNYEKKLSKIDKFFLNVKWI